MAGDSGETHECVLPMNDVHVRAADAGVGHIDLDLAMGNLGSVDLGQPELEGCSYLERFHRVTPGGDIRPAA
jgi:hypothetical protein